MDLSAELARPGLDGPLRLLALTMGAIRPADWSFFREVVDRARHDGVARADFEETLLQAILFFGLPRIVTSFEQLSDIWPVAEAPEGGSVPADDYYSRGRELFAAVYAHNDQAIRDRLRSFHAEFHDFVIEAAYGRILARDGLDPRTRELLAVTALWGLDQQPQLITHARGALHFGATREAVAEAMRCSRVAGERIEAMLSRI